MDLTPLFLTVLGGTPLMASYASMARNVSKDRMWGYMPNGLRMVSYLTIPLAFLAGGYMIYYSIDKIPRQTEVVHETYEPYGKYILYTAWVIFLMGANLWPIALIHKMSHIWTIGSLVVTAIGAALLADCVLNGQLDRKDPEFIVAVVAVSILVFQCGIMDLGLWSYYFLRHD
jgi:hypothetical protein